LKLNLSFRQTVSHAEDLRYASIKVKELEKHVLEHEWREKHSAQHHRYSIVLYIVISIVLLYVFVRLILCIRSKGLCWRLAGALKIHPASDENPRVTGSGNVVNITSKPVTRVLLSLQKIFRWAPCHPPTPKA
jgi:hypothetical protein